MSVWNPPCFGRSSIRCFDPIFGTSEKVMAKVSILSSSKPFHPLATAGHTELFYNLTLGHRGRGVKDPNKSLLHIKLASGYVVVVNWVVFCVWGRGGPLIILHHDEFRIKL